MMNWAVSLPMPSVDPTRHIHHLQILKKLFLTPWLLSSPLVVSVVARRKWISSILAHSTWASAVMSISSWMVFPTCVSEKTSTSLSVSSRQIAVAVCSLRHGYGTSAAPTSASFGDKSIIAASHASTYTRNIQKVWSSSTCFLWSSPWEWLARSYFCSSVYCHICWEPLMYSLP